MSSHTTIWNERASEQTWTAVGVLLRPLQVGLAFPSLLYLGTLAVFLFRPPDVELYYADRIAFCILVFFVLLRGLATRERLPWVAGISWPMLGLIGLAVVRALREPFDTQTWSLVASKFVVPFVLFHLSILVFNKSNARTHFEIFTLIVLGYLIFTAIAFLVGAHSLIYPSFILDESLGHHVNRARGPFLQAVANGVALNVLGLTAIVFSQTRQKLVLLLWIALPVAILATMTRAVWISFALSTVAVAIRLGQRRMLQVCSVIAAVGLLAGLVIGLGNTTLQDSLSDRAGERGPIEVRFAVYQAGWEMFREHPVSGWTAGRMYEELARRMQGYRLRAFYVHNTYLSMLIEFGIPGLLLYLILFFNLFRLSRPRMQIRAECGWRANLRRVFPVLLGVFLFNALFVDMVYQFVNGLLFTIAGIWCARWEEVA